ncbi:MAG TPA: alpha-amylase family glycosyl hydrolase, partial [Bacillota bacterium]|nr:alpha-amylase family glycosyl hydrolase [Bacillota bacterium]
MADNTSRSLRSSFVYQVFVRNYSEAGDFKELTADLERIRALGADIIHLLPIHPIGLKRRKGSLGSPYAIKDYTSIDPAYGREEDLSELLRKAHSLGMRVLMD